GWFRADGDQAPCPPLLVSTWFCSAAIFASPCFWESAASGEEISIRPQSPATGIAAILFLRSRLPAAAVIPSPCGSLARSERFMSTLVVSMSWRGPVQGAGLEMEAGSPRLDVGQLPGASSKDLVNKCNAGEIGLPAGDLYAYP